MNKSTLLTASQVKEALQISQASAYRVIQTLNQELQEKGFLVLQGRVSKKYFYERFYGMVVEA